MKSIFHVFFEEHASHVAKIAQGPKGRVLRKKFVFIHKILDFHFFHFFLRMVMHDVTFNVNTTI